MSIRSDLIDYMHHGSKKPFVSLQIGAGAGFDTKLAGKTWNSETTLQDTIRAYEIAGGHPLFNIGLPDIAKSNPVFVRKTNVEDKENERITESWMETPFGQLYWKGHEIPKQGYVPISYPVSFNDGLKAFDYVRWTADQHAKSLDFITEDLGADLELLKKHGPVSVQWNLQLFGLPTVDIENTKGHKHMIAASDYLFYDIPLENVQVIVKIAENYRI